MSVQKCIIVPRAEYFEISDMIVRYFSHFKNTYIYFVLIIEI